MSVLSPLERSQQADQGMTKLQAAHQSAELRAPAKDCCDELRDSLRSALPALTSSAPQSPHAQDSPDAECQVLVGNPQQLRSSSRSSSKRVISPGRSIAGRLPAQGSSTRTRPGPCGRARGGGAGGSGTHVFEHLLGSSHPSSHTTRRRAWYGRSPEPPDRHQRPAPRRSSDRSRAARDQWGVRFDGAASTASRAQVQKIGTESQPRVLIQPADLGHASHSSIRSLKLRPKARRI